MEPVRVAICVATYARPKGLTRLLDGLTTLAIDAPAADRPIAIRVIVIDNDSDGAMRAICDRYASCFALGLQYDIEPTRGISRARNLAVQHAGTDVEFIAMIDDDEVPDPRWLAELLKAQERFAADVVAGPVEPYFPTTPPAWVVRGRFFQRPRYHTGHPLPHAATGNVLVRKSVFDLTGSFDNRFALVGGEDLQFFRRARALGAQIIFAADALVTEWIPASRANTQWLVRRAFRTGLTNGQVDRQRKDFLLAVPARVVRGGGRMVQGLIVALLAVLSPAALRRVRLVRGLQLVWRGAGMITGVLGGTYEEYRVTHPV